MSFHYLVQLKLFENSLNTDVHVYHIYIYPEFLFLIKSEKDVIPSFFLELVIFVNQQGFGTSPFNMYER